MHYELTGSGSDTFVLLHNAGGDHSFFHMQVAMLAKLGRVLAIDLPGHGRSKAEKKYSVGLFASDVKDLCDNLGLGNIIGVGLNYGANIFLDFAEQFPGALKLLVMIDPPIFLSGKVRDLINNNIMHLESPAGALHADELVAQSFVRASDATKNVALRAFSLVDSDFLAAIYKDLLVWDKGSKPKVESLAMPCLTIVTDAALCSIEDLSACNQRIKTAKVVGSMYWATLEVPDQINSMLHRFFDIELPQLK